MSRGVFLDTAGLYAVFHAEDEGHQRAAVVWEALICSDVPLHTSSYVLLELVSLLQRRLGTAAVEVLITRPSLGARGMDRREAARAGHRYLVIRPAARS